MSLLLEGLSISSLFSGKHNEKIHHRLVSISYQLYVHCPPYSRCTELMRSLYLLRISLLRPGSLLLSSMSALVRAPPSSSSLSDGSPLLRPATPFCRGFPSSVPPTLFIFGQLISCVRMHTMQLWHSHFNSGLGLMLMAPFLSTHALNNISYWKATSLATEGWQINGNTNIKCLGKVLGHTFSCQNSFSAA